MDPHRCVQVIAARYLDGSQARRYVDPYRDELDDPRFARSSKNVSKRIFFFDDLQMTVRVEPHDRVYAASSMRGNSGSPGRTCAPSGVSPHLRSSG